MGKSRNRSLKLGFLVSVGLLLFVLAVYYLGSKQNLFSSSFTVKSYFYNVKGLVVGNNVRYSGIDVGIVSTIEIVSDSTILVELSIREEVREYIRKDSKVEIGREGLMGNKIVFVHPGNPNAGSVEDDGELESVKSVDIGEMLREANKIINDGQIFSTNMLEVSNKINNGNGDLARLINDSTLSTALNRAGEEFVEIAKNANEITDKINRGEGDIGRLINDTTITSQVAITIANINQVTERADTITHEFAEFSRMLNEGDGLIHRLVYDSAMAENIDTTITKVSAGVDDIVDAADQISDSWIFNLFSGKNKKRKRN